MVNICQVNQIAIMLPTYSEVAVLSNPKRWDFQPRWIVISNISHFKIIKWVFTLFQTQLVQEVKKSPNQKPEHVGGKFHFQLKVSG